jgi:hypothetical protein
MKLDRLQERIEFHRERIKAYELVLEDLNGHLTERATDQLPAKLQKAIQLRHGVFFNGTVVGARQQQQMNRQAVLRDFIKPDQAYKITHLMKALKARGYVPSLKTMHLDLKAVGVVAGAGRLWHLQSTAAASPAAAAPRQTKKKKWGGTYSSKVKQQRKKTAKLLAKLDKLDAPFPSTAFGHQGSVLLRHGYIKKDGDGYARTEKQFTV